MYALIRDILSLIQTSQAAKLEMNLEQGGFMLLTKQELDLRYKEYEGTRIGERG